MKKLNFYLTGLLVLAMLLFSCSKEEKLGNVVDSEKATISFGTLLNDLVSENSGARQAVRDLPECSDAEPFYVEVALSQDGAWVVGSDTEPVRVNLNQNPADFDGDGVDNYFTNEAEELELIPGTYSLEYFSVYDADGNALWIAPRTTGSFAGLVDSPLPMTISLGAGVKKYVSVDVICFDDRVVNEYGYLFFDLQTNQLIEFCIFGNFCNEDGRHFPAHFNVNVWKYSGDSNNPRGQAIIINSSNNVGVNDAGDAFADPLCVVLPDSEGNDEYYFEITLLESEAYDTQSRIIRSGVITDDDVRALYDGEDNTEYYHFREGNCGTGDTPGLFIEEGAVRSSSASYPELVTFSRSSSSEDGLVYEVLPGPAVLEPSISPTGFSNNIAITTGTYSYTVVNPTEGDSEDSQDAVTSIDIRFTGNDGIEYLIDDLNVTHKEEGSGGHTFFGGVGQNKVIHGNTGIGTNLEPKLLAYIALWGTTDLKDANTGEVIAENRKIHIMTTTRVRTEDLKLINSRDEDMTNHNIRKAETHIIMPPEDLQGNMDPIPGTAHGFLHMMFEEVNLSDASRDWTLVYEILPGPAAIDPSQSPTPFSNRVAIAAGSYNYTAFNRTAGDSESSEDEVSAFSFRFERAGGKVFTMDNLQVIHKEEGTGEHTYFGGVGFDEIIHGNTGIGTPLEPKLLAYIAYWAKGDLKDGEGNVITEARLVHIMTTSRVRTEDLFLITSTAVDETDHSPDKIETHIIIPPMNLMGEMDPVPNTGHGFLHLMFEEVSLER